MVTVIPMGFMFYQQGLAHCPAFAGRWSEPSLAKLGFFGGFEDKTRRNTTFLWPLTFFLGGGGKRSQPSKSGQEAMALPTPSNLWRSDSAEFLSSPTLPDVSSQFSKLSSPMSASPPEVSGSPPRTAEPLVGSDGGCPPRALEPSLKGSGFSLEGVGPQKQEPFEGLEMLRAGCFSPNMGFCTGKWKTRNGAGSIFGRVHFLDGKTKKGNQPGGVLFFPETTKGARPKSKTLVFLIRNSRGT